MSNLQVKFRRLSPLAIMPTRAHPDDAGLDLYALVETTMLTLTHMAVRLVRTGWAIEIPPGYEGQVRPRSGLALKHGVTVLNAPGTIDPQYRGEVGVILVNHGLESHVFKHGDRIAQLVIAPVALATPVEVAELEETERGAGGFGSSGR